MTVTITPIAVPTGLTATLQAGGSLAPNTTYYYVVISFPYLYYTSLNISYDCEHSALSAEGSFTTDAVNLSALIKWTNPTGGVYYQILLSTTSGDYTGTKCVGAVTIDKVDTAINDGTVGYLMSAVPSTNHVIHSAQLVNSLPFNFNKHLGSIKIVVSGTYSHGTLALQQFYDDIVSAGYGAYVSYDGVTFGLKGTITAEGTASGSFRVYYRNLFFYHGGIKCKNPNYYFQFGYTANNAIGGYPYYSCSISTSGYRSPILSSYSKGIRMYECRLSLRYNYNIAVTEPVYNIGYQGTGYLSLAVDGIQDTIVTDGVRALTTDLKDMKVSIANNWSNYNNVRLKVFSNRTDAYYAGGVIYDTNFPSIFDSSTVQALRKYVPAAVPNPSWYSNRYDCMFPQCTNNIPPFFYVTTYGRVTTDDPYYINYTLKLRVVDDKGENISGASINVIDTHDNSALWIEHDGTTDRLITGNEYTTPRTTDANGEIDYYILAYKVELASDNTIATSYCDNVVFTTYYPFKIIITKAGYQTTIIPLDTLLKKTELTIVLKPVISTEQLNYDSIA